MKSYPKIIDRILEVIREHKTFCIVGHVRPDGDCIGSQLGLAIALRNEGKRVTVWNEDSVPQKLKFLDPDALFQKPKRGHKFDCVIATDCASFQRLGKAGDCIANRKVFINIDHHESNTRYADVNWVSAREPSSGELIFRLLKVARWRSQNSSPTICSPPSRPTPARFNIPPRAPARFTPARNSSRAVRISPKSVTKFIKAIRSHARDCSSMCTASSASPTTTRLPICG